MKFSAESIRGCLYGGAIGDAAGVIGQLIEVGGDTDTNASLAGQIMGARTGFSSLPHDLFERLPQRAVLASTIDAFCERWASSSCASG